LLFDILKSGAAAQIWILIYVPIVAIMVES